MDRRTTIQWLRQLFLMPLISAVVLFAAAGRIDWLWGWVFLAFYLASGLVTYVVVRDPGLIAERVQRKEGTESWDRQFLRLYTLFYFMMLIVAGLDAGRYHWSPALPTPLLWIGWLGLLATSVIGNWAMHVNRYFSTFVRIQLDRSHTVITGGPYRLIRHPGNLAMITWLLGAALMLQSLWALLPSALGAVVIIMRTTREDATLLTALDGYADYARRVRYRLLPGVW